MSRLATLVLPLPLGPGDALALPFQHDLALELGHAGDDVEVRSGGGCTGGDGAIPGWYNVGGVVLMQRNLKCFLIQFQRLWNIGWNRHGQDTDT